MPTVFEGLPIGTARVILADPPWSFKTYSKKNISKAPDAHYDCLPLSDIKALPVYTLADPGGCVLILWATSPMLPQALEVMSAWKFTYKTQGQWLKMTKNWKQAFSTGYIYRSASEPWLVGTIGHPKSLAKNIRNVIVARTREHSRKPDIMRKNIEKQWAGPYVELFGRQAVAGWTVWGNQVSRFPANAAMPAARLIQGDLLEAA